MRGVGRVDDRAKSLLFLIVARCHSGRPVGLEESASEFESVVAGFACKGGTAKASST